MFTTVLKGGFKVSDYIGVTIEWYYLDTKLINWISSAIVSYLQSTFALNEFNISVNNCILRKQDDVFYLFITSNIYVL